MITFNGLPEPKKKTSRAWIDISFLSILTGPNHQPLMKVNDEFGYRLNNTNGGTLIRVREVYTHDMLENVFYAFDNQWLPSTKDIAFKATLDEIHRPIKSIQSKAGQVLLSINEPQPRLFIVLSNCKMLQFGILAVEGLYWSTSKEIFFAHDASELYLPVEMIITRTK